jgi:hypothetical protein
MSWRWINDVQAARRTVEIVLCGRIEIRYHAVGEPALKVGHVHYTLKVAALLAASPSLTMLHHSIHDAAGFLKKDEVTVSNEARRIV